MDRADIDRVITPLEGEKAHAQEKRVREEFWPKFQRFASRLPFAEDVAAAWFCAIDRDTPLRARGALLAALAYFIMPLDFVPDLLAFVGMGDDIAVLTVAITTLKAHITDKHREQAREAVAQAGQAGPISGEPIKGDPTMR
ncbi:MAG: YkvA family protein [Ahrensia sp.]|nr:YkvA family protein [Ahrensia sp.]